MNNLDFNTDGDGATYTGTGNADASDNGDAYHNGGSGWNPIGDDGTNLRFNAMFKGNGYIISNLFMKRTSRSDAGFFGRTVSGARIETVGLVDAYVYATNWVGILVGNNRGPITTSYTTAEVRGSSNVGGLVGYATGNNVTTSYSTGTVITTANSNVGGLIGIISPIVTVTASYWNTNGNNRPDDSDSNMPEGKTTTKLQSVTSYTAIYANWNLDLDGDRVPDNPWNCGTPSQWVIDYDSDGLIDVKSLLQLNAIRHDLNGDGLPIGTRFC